MHGDFTPAKLPKPVAPKSEPLLDDLPPLEPEHEPAHDASKRRSPVWGWIIGVGLAIGICAALVVGWYATAILPLNGSDTSTKRITVTRGQGSAEIADTLEREGIIRSALAFRVYTRLNAANAPLQAGTYALSPSQSLETIVDHLAEGRVDSLRVTILPGQTLRKISATLQQDYGFTEEEVTAALNATYDHPVLRDRPAGASLEGYIFPDTYQVAGDGSLEQLFRLSFDELWEQLNTDDTLGQLQRRNLNIHQAVTLASIIQMEVSDETDQRKVSQVFQKRLREGIELGSDVTYQYAADQRGVPRSVNLDSPYNTRRVKGLPPGPIANFNPSALTAVAEPAAGDFLYFVAGENGMTYYARTLAEHEQNVDKYCGRLCEIE